MMKKKRKSMIQGTRNVERAKKMASLKYRLAIASAFMMENKGNKGIGRIEVTTNGKASVIQFVLKIKIKLGSSFIEIKI
jgi:predicted hotdog family 3-hydroxylacyl-ACP dehydratase